jgi:hypothetical protein
MREGGLGKRLFSFLVLRLSSLYESGKMLVCYKWINKLIYI